MTMSVVCIPSCASCAPTSGIPSASVARKCENHDPDPEGTVSATIDEDIVIHLNLGHCPRIAQWQQVMNKIFPSCTQPLRINDQNLRKTAILPDIGSISAEIA
jgi:hypothetical protein